MRMLRVGIHLELAPHGFAELGLGEHPANRLFHDPRRVLLTKVLGALYAKAALVSAVIPVDLLFVLAAGQPHLGGVDHDHMVARIDMWRVYGFVLALQQTRCFGRYPSEDLTRGVNHVPLPLHTAGGGNKRTHRNPFGLCWMPRSLSACCWTATHRSEAQAVGLSQRTANQEDTSHPAHCQACETAPLFPMSRARAAPCWRGTQPLHLQNRYRRSDLSMLPRVVGAHQCQI